MTTHVRLRTCLRAASALVILVALLGGCPLSQTPLSSSIDGTWTLTYTNAPNATDLTISNGRVVAERPRGGGSVTITDATQVFSFGSNIMFGYCSWQTANYQGQTLSADACISFSGVLQGNGSIAGTMYVDGYLNGQRVQGAVPFTMYRH